MSQYLLVERVKQQYTEEEMEPDDAFFFPLVTEG